MADFNATYVTLREYWPAGLYQLYKEESTPRNRGAEEETERYEDAKLFSRVSANSSLCMNTHTLESVIMHRFDKSVEIGYARI